MRDNPLYLLFNTVKRIIRFMKYLDTKTGKEIVVYPYQVNLLFKLNHNPGRYHKLFEE